MLSTKYVVDNYNFQTVLWDSTAFAVWTVRTTLRTAWLSFQMALLALAYVAIVAAEVAVPVVKALALVAILAGAVVFAVTCWQFVAGGLVVSAYAYATMPKAGK